MTGPFVIQLRGALAEQSSMPAYRRLARAIEDMIERGELLPGTRLPPERDLAAGLRIARNTVVKAYGVLSTERLIRRDRGRGTTVSGDTTVAVSARMGELATSAQRSVVFRTLSDSPVGTIDLLAASVPSNPRVTELLSEAWERVDLTQLVEHHGYYPFGFPPLRAAIADHLSRHGLRTIDDQVLITSGAQQAISLVAAWVSDAAGIVVVENPTYPGAIDAFRAAGARILTLPLGPDGLDVDELEAHVSTGLVRAIFVMPTFHNPTGFVMPVSARQQLAELARAGGTVVVEDHAMGDIRITSAPIPPPIAALAGPESPIIYIDSLSKTYWGGLRVGWIRAPRSIISHLARVRTSADLAGVLPTQAMAVDLVARLDEVSEIRRRELAERLEAVASLMTGLLPDWRWRAPTGGLCLWARLPYGSATELAVIAARHGVAIVSGAVMSADAQFDDHVRLPLGAALNDLEQGLARLGHAWNEYAHANGSVSHLVV